MSFAELLPQNSIIYDLKATQRDEALRETLTRLKEIGSVEEGEYRSWPGNGSNFCTDYYRSCELDAH